MVVQLLLVLYVGGGDTGGSVDSDTGGCYR